MQKIAGLFLFLIFQSSYLCAGIYDLDYTNKEKEAEAIFQDDIFVRLRLKEKPDTTLAIFIYNIEKIKNPHKVPDQVFQEGLFLLEKGNLHLSKEEYEKAIELYQEALKVNPSFLAGYHNMGIAYFMLGSFTESIEYFNRVLELSPQEGLPYFYIGWIYKILENQRKAYDYLSTAKKAFTSQGDTVMMHQASVLLESLEILPKK